MAAIFFFSRRILFGGRNVAQLVEHQRGTLLRMVQFPGAARDFSPKVSFQCRLSYSDCAAPRVQ